MKKKEPAWKAELKSDLHMADLDDDPLWPVIEKHIVAAEQRGFQAGVNRTGDSVGKLREQLKAANGKYVEALKADWSRYRGNVLDEAWKAMRDAEGGPMIEAMQVINGLMERS